MKKVTENPKTVEKAEPEATRTGMKTDYPLSEKDEVKQAEEKMRKASKKNK